MTKSTWSDGGYMYLTGRAERHNGEMEVRLYEEIYPNPLGTSPKGARSSKSKKQKREEWRKSGTMRKKKAEFVYKRQTQRCEYALCKGLVIFGKREAVRRLFKDV